MLPLSRSGRVSLAHEVGDEPEVVLDRLVAALLERKAQTLRREAAAVTFAGGAFRLVWGWNILTPISWGRVEAVRGPRGVELQYRIAFTEVVAIATLLIGLASVPIILDAGSDAGVGRFIAPVVMWLWAVGINIAFALVRFPAFLRRVGNRTARIPEAEPVAAPDPAM